MLVWGSRVKGLGAKLGHRSLPLFTRPCYESAKKLPRKRKYIFNKSANVKSIKPQLVSHEAQQRQCQSYTKNKKTRIKQ